MWNILSYFNHKFLKQLYNFYLLYVTGINNADYYRL